MNLARFERLQSALATAAALNASLDLGVFAALAEAPLSPAELADRCALDTRAATLILAMLREAGAVEQLKNGRMAATVPLAQIQWARRMWDGLPARARAMKPAVAMDGEDAETLYAELAPALARHSRRAAVAAAAHLAADGLDVLDVGAGAAPWSLAILERADVRVTAVDLPGVTPATRAAVEQKGVSARFTVLGRDIRNDGLGHDAFDLAIVGHVLHLFPEEDNRRLVRNIHVALRPGGPGGPHRGGVRSAAHHARARRVRTGPAVAHPSGEGVPVFRLRGVAARGRLPGHRADGPPGGAPAVLVTATA